MSLVCIETGKDIEFGRPLMAASIHGLDFFSAVSKEVIDRIPLKCRFIEPVADGVCIHVATSGENFNGSYTWSGFTLGEFLFSIGAPAADMYLPKFAQQTKQFRHVKPTD